MDNEQLVMLKRNVEEWNNWRINDITITVDLQGANLKNANLQGANLEKANLHGANLMSADLQGAKLHHAKLTEANMTRTNLELAGLIGADLTGLDLHSVKLKGANLRYAKLRGARLPTFPLEGVGFEDADLREANLNGVKLKGLNLHNANLMGANLMYANLEETNLNDANLEKAILVNSNLKGASLRRANLEGADLRHANLEETILIGAKKYVLDENNTRNTRFSPTPADPWSTLRSKYTGPAMLWTILALIAAFAPYAAKVIYWSAFNRTQISSGEVLTCENHECYAVWQLALGIDKGALYWMIPCILIFYNVVRGGLTICVAPIRDEEERSGYSPPWVKLRPLDLRSRAYFAKILGSYRLLYWAHNVIRPFLWLSIVVFLYNAYYWLFLLVLLPKAA